MLDLGHGLGLFVCKDGDGRTFPKVGDKLTMHYIGRLTKDDAEFDSSRARGAPFMFEIGVGRVIKGWDEGVMKMSLGERGILQVPAAKAYGARGAGGKIPPNADLYFDVELLAINGKAEPEKLPEQGYSGKKVAHKDMETCTDDWRQEYGNAKETKKVTTKPEPKPTKSGSVASHAFSWAIVAIALFAPALKASHWLYMLPRIWDVGV
jgi:FK506-binding protein 1